MSHLRCWLRHPLCRRYAEGMCGPCYVAFQRSLSHHPAGRRR